MLIWGTRTKGEVVSNIAPFDSYCPVCKTETRFVVKTPVQRFTLYFIPTFKIGGGREQFQECQLCSSAFVYDAEQSQQMETKKLPLLFLSCAAHVINADGQVLDEEIATAYAVICTLFDIEDQSVKELTLSVLLNEIRQPSPLNICIRELANQVEDSILVNLLVESLLVIACADNELHENEIKMILSIAKGLGMPSSTWNQMLRVKKKTLVQEAELSLATAAEILGLGTSYKPRDVKRAYHRTVAQYHPDKVEHLGPEIRALAANKTTQINEAYAVLNG